MSQRTHTHTHRPVTLAALQDDLVLAVVQQTDGAGSQAGTRRTLSVVILPLAPQPRRGGATLGARYTPAKKQDMPTHSVMP